MGNFAEFHLSPDGVRNTEGSNWQIRDEGIGRILEGAWRFLMEWRSLDRAWRVRIHTHDWPTGESIRLPDLMEFQTISEMGKGGALFPDWVFGGWWHIGMNDWESFVSELSDAGESPPKDQRAFWKGAHLNVRQRARYVEICESHPNMFSGGMMRWGRNGVSQGFTPMKEQCEHAVLVDLSGVGFSGRLKILGFTGRPLIVAKRRWFSWADQEMLSQGLHHEVAEDLSDIVPVYESILSNMESSVEKAKRLKDYCKRELTFEKVCLRAARLIAIKTQANKIFL